jgi:[glutamine synthetase] adenylyltransferase / [glutamine synthetase]-adenylyl-L-tyrosine phosphorylase
MNTPPDTRFETRCADPAQCRKIYERILQRCVKAVPGRHAALDASLRALLCNVPSPDRALVQLDRFLEASFSPSSMLDDFAHYDGLLEAFVRLVSASTFLADTLVRDSELFRWMILSGVLHEERSRESFFIAAGETSARFPTAERRITSLRRFQRRELLRIAARDILIEPAFDVTVREISWLADAVVSVLLDESRAQVSERFGGDPRMRIAILGLGKLGGEELNYSSDIDLMVVYEENTGPADAMETHERVVRVIETLTGHLTRQTSEGFFYRTDFRLRPDGSAGPIALSLPATLAYYESRGAFWERQMLLKARIVAGDAEFGARVLEQLLPFTFPRTLAAPLSTVLNDIRSRVAPRWKAVSDVKHGRGGIRQAEFCAQALQLLNGGSRPDLRAANTRAALRALMSAELITPAEHACLDGGYVFLRRVEHALQLEAFEQTHELPADDERLRVISWTLGFGSVEEFQRRLSDVRDGIVRVWDTVFTHGDISARPDARDYDGARLSEMGFGSATAAEKTLRLLTEGRAAKPRGTAFRARMRDLLPALVNELAAGLLPGRTLKTIEAGFDRISAPEALLDYFSVSGSRMFLLHLAAAMPGAFLGACGSPLVFDAIFSGMVENAEGRLHPAESKLIRETDACGRFLLDRLPLPAFVKELSRIADSVVSRIYAGLGAADGTPFTIVAMGKYGGRELSPGSDLDVVFLFTEREGFGSEDAQRLAARFIGEMHGGIETEKLYTVDARLRPEGRNSPLAVSLGAYCRYLDKRASLWEKQSLLKARCVSGSPELAREYASMIAERFARQAAAGSAIDEMLSMRRKMEPENRFRLPNFFDVKLSAGGLVDAEFAVQAVQLMFVPRNPALLIANTFEAIEAIAREFPSLREEMESIPDAYEYLRRLQILMRTMLDAPSNLLPADGDALAALASAMGRSSTSAFLSDLDRRRSALRISFERVTNYLRTTAEKQ